MSDFLVYDASQWMYEATLVPLRKAVASASKKVRREGVRQLVMLAAGIALGVTHIERELPPVQAAASWEAASLRGADVVPIGYWPRLVERVQTWPVVTGDAKVPDFDSLV